MHKKIPVIAVFDIGKTNKKLLVFDERYQVVKEVMTSFAEMTDEDGFPCEDLEALSSWLQGQYQQLKNDPIYALKAVNFTTYGAALVYLDESGKPVGRLYNYLKPYPEDLYKCFENSRGGGAAFSVAVSAPLMGHLNAGMQLYFIKSCKPALFKTIKHVLHFPQYLSYLMTGKIAAEMTSLGCHSAMWDFTGHDYHPWLKQEGIQEKLATVTTGNQAVKIKNDNSGTDIAIGTGLHDSSAAMIPYLATFKEPFMILSTGTWAVSLNPFNTALPDEKELSAGCFSYLTYEGQPVKTSMLFSGNDHDQQIKRIAQHFSQPTDFFKTVPIDSAFMKKWTPESNKASITSATQPSAFQCRSLKAFVTAAEAYHQLIADIINQQKLALAMVLKGSGVEKIYIDGGFCLNPLYMQFMANAFADKQVYAATMTQGTALGAALALHHHWNTQPTAENLIQLKRWPATTQ